MTGGPAQRDPEHGIGCKACDDELPSQVGGKIAQVFIRLRRTEQVRDDDQRDAEQTERRVPPQQHEP